MGNYPPVDGFDANGYAPPLEEGFYTVRLIDIETEGKDGKFTYSDGTAYERFKFEVEGQPNMVFDRFSFDPNYEHASIQLGRFKQFLEAAGVDPTKGGDTASLKGKVCRVFIKNTHKGDKIYNNIRQYEPIDPGSKPEFNDDDDLPF